MKILIVEPNRDIAAITLMFCHLTNITAATVETFEEAYELAQETDFDGFILDIPECENHIFEHIDKLRRYGERRELRQRFIGTAASIIPTYCVKAFLHLDRLYPKPVSLQLLVDAVLAVPGQNSIKFDT